MRIKIGGSHGNHPMPIGGLTSKEAVLQVAGEDKTTDVEYIRMEVLRIYHKLIKRETISAYLTEK